MFKRKEARKKDYKIQNERKKRKKERKKEKKERKKV